MDLDETIQIGIAGRTLALEHQRITDLINAIRSQPERLSSTKLFNDAERAVAEAKALPYQTPLFTQAIEQVRSLLQQYRDPVRVTLISDNAIEISLSNVGSLGPISERTLTLRPGKYTLRGSKDRDIYTEIVVLPDIAPIKVFAPRFCLSYAFANQPAAYSSHCIPTQCRQPRHRGHTNLAMGVRGYCTGHRSRSVVPVYCKERDAEFLPNASEVDISGGVSIRLGDVVLLREGRYTVKAKAEQHKILEAPLEVTSASNQTLNLNSYRHQAPVLQLSPEDAQIYVDDVLQDNPVAAQVRLTLEAGVRSGISSPRHLPRELKLNIEGKNKNTRPQCCVRSACVVSVRSEPAGAEVWVDDQNTGVTTPAEVDILQGEHSISLRKAGYKAFNQKLLTVPVFLNLDAAR